MSYSALTATRSAITAPAGASLMETFLGLCLVTLLGGGAWSLFASMPAYGGQPTPPPVAQVVVALPAPVCFNHTRQEAQAQTPAFQADVARGCPSNPMAYNPATLRQVQG